MPNTLTDGTPALASEVNENFQTLANAVNASDCATPGEVVCGVSCPVVPACDTLGSYRQGYADGGNAVDITSDDLALRVGAGGTDASAANTCSVELASDDPAARVVSGADRVGRDGSRERKTGIPGPGDGSECEAPARQEAQVRDHSRPRSIWEAANI